ncbi:NAD(P)-binding protein [Streptomyces coeruleorubidus]
MDLLVVGGGPAGLATALHAARADRRSWCLLVLERVPRPGDAVAGWRCHEVRADHRLRDRALGRDGTDLRGGGEALRRPVGRPHAAHASEGP